VLASGVVGEAGAGVRVGIAGLLLSPLDGVEKKR